MRNSIQDVKISDHRSVRQIPLPGRRGGELRGSNDDPLQYEGDRVEAIEIENSGWSRVVLWVAVAACVIVLAFVFSWTLSGATVRVIPKSAAVVLERQDLFEAVRGGGSEGELSFEAFEQTKTGEEVIPARTEKQAAERASGTIVVYNNYSEAPQRLIKNTRFESPQGRIYRIDRSLVVPGRKDQKGKIIPGSAEAVVFADSPGASYNSSLTDFTIPGFKSDPARYSAFYARSKTPIEGGFEGVRRIPDEAAEKAARENVRQKVAAELSGRAKQSVLPELIFFDGAYRVNAEPLPNEERGDAEVAVREKITLTAFFFSRAELAAAVAKKALTGYDGRPVSISSFEPFSLGFAADQPDENRLAFTLSGNAQIVYGFDEAGLAEALRGKPKGEVAAVLASFPTIEKVEVKMRPFWRRSFPGKVEKLKIEKAKQ